LSLAHEYHEGGRGFPALRTGGKLGIRSSRPGAGRNRKSGDWSAKRNWSVDLVTGPDEVRV
jgi:hypothetical protein